MTFCKLVADAAMEEYGQKSNPQVAQLLRNRIKKLCAPVPGYGPQDTVELFLMDQNLWTGSDAGADAATADAAATDLSRVDGSAAWSVAAA